MRFRECFLLPLLCFLVLSGCSGSGRYSQPIAFNHNKHVEEIGLTCFDCHIMVENHRKATIPNIETCGNCHADAMTDSKEEEKLVGYVKNNQAIPWKQVHRVPDHAYFSHRRHVSLGKVACQDCHGDVSKMTLPFERPHVPVKMEFCIRCHEKRNVDTDCATCHR